MAHHTKSLMSRVAEICKVDEKTLTQLQFVSKTKYFFGKGYVELCLNEHMRPYVLALKERFTEIELGYAIRLSSFYAIRIYELLKCGQYRQGGFNMSLEELRAELGIEKGKLERIDNFKAKVMNIAEREINNRTDINFAYEWIKTGRGVTGVRFAVREQVTKPIKTLPGTEADTLWQRLEDAGMPREEALSALRKWAHADAKRLEALKIEGGGQDSDPRGTLISRFTGHSAAEVSYVIELCLAVLVEFSAAFGLFLALEGAKDLETPLAAKIVREPNLEIVRGGRRKTRRKAGQGAMPPPRRIRFGGKQEGTEV